MIIPEDYRDQFEAILAEMNALARSDLRHLAVKMFELGSEQGEDEYIARSSQFDC